MKKILTFIALYFLLSAVAVVGLGGLPYHPKTVAGWVLLFALALPLTIVGELIAEFLWRNRVARRIASQTPGLSLLRMGYVFVVVLLFFGVAIAIQYWLRDPFAL